MSTDYEEIPKKFGFKNWGQFTSRRREIGLEKCLFDKLHFKVNSNAAYWENDDWVIKYSTQNYNTEFLVLTNFDKNDYLAIQYSQVFLRNKFFLNQFKKNKNYLSLKECAINNDLNMSIYGGVVEHKSFSDEEPYSSNGYYPKTTIIVKGLVTENNLYETAKIINYLEGKDKPFNEKLLLTEP